MECQYQCQRVHEDFLATHVSTRIFGAVFGVLGFLVIFDVLEPIGGLTGLASLAVLGAVLKS